MLIVAAIIRRGDTILLVAQQGTRDLAPDWALPGGVMEAGEILTEALVREVREETGLKILDPGHVAYVAQTVHRRTGLIATAFIFDVTAWEGIVQPNDPDAEILEARFFPIPEAIAALERLHWAVMREPIISYLQGRTSSGTLWLYREDQEGHVQQVKRVLGSGGPTQ